MNERIQELRDEILAEAYQKQQGMDWVMERFAELIIAECIEAAGDPADGLIKGNTWHDGVRASIWSIKQYFGVK